MGVVTPRERQLELKIELLKAQLERSCRYDPEWGPDPEDAPLRYLIAVERRIKQGASPHDWVLIGLAGQILASNRLLDGLTRGRQFSGGEHIEFPLHWSKQR